MKLDWLKNDTKAKFACLAVLSILLYAFLVLIIFGFSGGSAFWISFVFAVISIALAYYISYLSMNTARKLSDWIFSLPVIRWCVIYVVVEIMIAMVFMIFHAPWRIVFLPQFLLPIFFLILVVPSFAQKSHVATVSKETVVKVSYVRQMNAKLLALVPRTEDPTVKKELEKVADMIRHSDPMSADSLKEHEQKMLDHIDLLDRLIREGNYTEAASAIKEIGLLTEERNQLVVASKLIQY